jgi:cell division protein FtsB
MIEHTTKPAAVKLGQWLNNEIPQPDKSELETLRNENAELKKQIDNLQKFSNELAKMLKRLAEIAETI